MSVFVCIHIWIYVYLIYLTCVYMYICVCTHVRIGRVRGVLCDAFSIHHSYLYVWHLECAIMSMYYIYLYINIVCVYVYAYAWCKGTVRFQLRKHSSKRESLKHTKMFQLMNFAGITKHTKWNVSLTEKVWQSGPGWFEISLETVLLDHYSPTRSIKRLVKKHRISVFHRSFWLFRRAWRSGSD